MIRTVGLLWIICGVCFATDNLEITTVRSNGEATIDILYQDTFHVNRTDSVVQWNLIDAPCGMTMDNGVVEWIPDSESFGWVEITVEAVVGSEVDTIYYQIYVDNCGC